MTWVTERTAIQGRFSNWTATKVQYPGIPFLEPAGPWISVHILNGEGIIATLGTPHARRHIGVVAVQIFDKENSGEVTIRTLADAVELLFINDNSRLTISGTEWIDFDQPELTPGFVQDGWRQRNVNVSYQRNEVK